MIAFLLAAAVSASTPCTTVQPSPAFVCHGGQWLPPGHPLIPPPVATPPPAPVPPPSTSTPVFRVGRRYVRSSTDLFIAGTGQLPDGTPVLFATCLAVGDNCFSVGYVRMLPAYANAVDWTEVPLP
jgi:hypothetical protein